VSSLQDLSIKPNVIFSVKYSAMVQWLHKKDPYQIPSYPPLVLIHAVEWTGAT